MGYGSAVSLCSGVKSQSLTFTQQIMVCLTTAIIQLSNTEIIILLFRVRISVNLPLIGPTGTVRINENDREGKSGLMTVIGNNNHMLFVSGSKYRCHLNSWMTSGITKSTQHQVTNPSWITAGNQSQILCERKMLQVVYVRIPIWRKRRNFDYSCDKSVGLFFQFV